MQSREVAIRRGASRGLSPAYYPATETLARESALGEAALQDPDKPVQKGPPPAGPDEIPLSALPPLAKADASRMCEACVGIWVVGILVGLLVGLTHMITRPLPDVDPALDWARPYATGLIDLWGVIAAGCLLRILFGNMGEVRRSLENSYPIPGRVAELLRSGSSLQGLHNQPGQDGRTYCVRCLVWRPSERSHHCSTCQRCTVGFDHHCGVLGRCIAWGTNLNGNMTYFLAILLMFAFGVATFIFAAVTRPGRPRRFPRTVRASP
eukprot:TRINITY_DN14351_c0_g1_i2.p1 TRINITY_DN14351_c0_g1~~TRINITY_DN14351_c0_g1_i2.p1  ORF type:complete len:266 (+),score=46.84 TRINITY_DN14351_c0_g1_i2:80-877(+)